MGMYTGLRGKVIFKDAEFAENYKFTLDSNETINVWQEMFRIFPEYKNLGKFSQMGRSVFIPCGAVCYLDWGDNFYKINGKEFEFACSLKNYESEIEFFVESVLPEIAEDWNLEIQYEEWIKPISATKKEGIDRESIKFDFEDEIDMYNGY